MFLKRVLVASSNPKKVKEIKEILQPMGIEVLSPPKKIEVEEWANTFIGNAYLKAKAYYETFKVPTLADDSGLIVNAIYPYPGVYSSRFHQLEVFGREKPEPNEDIANIRKLLRILENKKDRSAKFVSVVVLYLDNGKMLVSEGEVKGFITDTPKGNKGFGYDPIFVPEGYSKTFAEMEPEEKHKISHRGRALKNLIKLLEKFQCSN